MVQEADVGFGRRGEYIRQTRVPAGRSGPRRIPGSDRRVAADDPRRLAHEGAVEDAFSHPDVIVDMLRVERPAVGRVPERVSRDTALVAEIEAFGA